MRILPTSYGGITYRSRTEARWAVVFDQLGWRHFYEYEGFDLPAGWYLPDFYLPDVGTFFEVKGERPTLDERLKASQLSELTCKNVVISSGPPNHRRDPWEDDLNVFVPEIMEDNEVVVFEYTGGFVDRRWPHQPACSLSLGNLGHLGSLKEIGWKAAFATAADKRFGVYEL